ncbi:hypothetical protein COD11_19935 [Bacillus sp. AFS040349]|nr:hypothetical protein COD11_19935 [Bacillus sp. AFS040349]
MPVRGMWSGAGCLVPVTSRILSNGCTWLCGFFVFFQSVFHSQEHLFSQQKAQNYIGFWAKAS